ncbi:DUF1479 domain-containing protein [Coprinopsis cinerea okayama7|uniref:DUF1479 domain-containing protein n=1 Tax=Coprinopsis cinerea (strain Okayama-7 / 130 / ATCC MYA-4618 / FGSC 9003) TaxID=240176 RepID=A8NV46_COPC7|nr:DUF1479 domain-containing protein [Coprinopsis cinerea okayama7\|eukprot:XP_001836598.2 DUF1479 domain-containing protein [Coprinopsis cinerea okayama7\
MTDPESTPAPLPERFSDLKKAIAASYGPDFEKARKAWGEIVEELGRFVQVVEREGSDYIPRVKFQELDSLSEEEITRIRRVGTVVIQDIVDDNEAIAWRESLKAFVKDNPDVEGSPEEDKQFFQLYWTRAQVQARSHPNVLAATVWLNKLYHVKDEKLMEAEGVDLSTPLTYADRFRIRHPNNLWPGFPPHVDGGAIERWEDPSFRKCFADILSGDWRKHDPYDLAGRLNARSSLYGRPNQSSVFRTFQGWLAMSETAPTEGTLKVFPDVHLSNAYIILRPFFRPLVSPNSPDIRHPKNWELDLDSSGFAGIFPRDGGYAGPRPTTALHPHLELEKTMTSVPKVYPGDAVFWHCDVVHSVEEEHTGSEDSAGQYCVPMYRWILATGGSPVSTQVPFTSKSELDM